jgi:hypothetical protein
MKIYEVSFVSESMGDGYQRMYTMSRRAAARRIAELRRQHRQKAAAAQARQDCGDDHPLFRTYAVDNIHVKELTFRGTPRQMVLEALRYRSVRA